MLRETDGLWTVTGALETERLVLRLHTADDLDDLVAFHSDPEIVRYIPWPVRDRAATHAALTTKLTQFQAGPDQWLSLAVVYRADGRVIGEALLHRLESDKDGAEIGYVISREYQGKGLASEAVAALVDEARSSLGVKRFIAKVDPANDASLALLERAGFVVAGHPDPGTVLLEL